MLEDQHQRKVVEEAEAIFLVAAINNLKNNMMIVYLVNIVEENSLKLLQKGIFHIAKRKHWTLIKELDHQWEEVGK